MSRNFVRRGRGGKRRQEQQRHAGGAVEASQPASQPPGEGSGSNLRFRRGGGGRRCLGFVPHMVSTRAQPQPRLLLPSLWPAPGGSPGGRGGGGGRKLSEEAPSSRPPLAGGEGSTGREKTSGAREPAPIPSEADARLPGAPSLATLRGPSLKWALGCPAAARRRKTSSPIGLRWRRVVRLAEIRFETRHGEDPRVGLGGYYF